MSLPMGTCTCGRRLRRAFSTKSSVFVPWVPEAFHARFPVSVLKSDPREKPLDQSAIPLIAPSQLQPAYTKTSFAARVFGLRPNSCWLHKAPRRTREKTSGTQGTVFEARSSHVKN